MSKKKKNRAYNMMYEQQMRHLPVKTLDDLIDTIDKKLQPKRYACIIHDKDVDKNGTPVEPHVHAMLEFDNARYLSAVARKLGEIDSNGKPRTQQIAIWNDKVKNGYSYLVHETKNSLGKHQYNPDEVKANFDFVTEMANISQSVAIVKARQSAPVNMLLDALYEGSITKEEIEQRLSGSQYGMVKNKIESVYAKRLQNMAHQWRKDAKAQGKQIRVMWICGKAATGKTSLAKEQAEKKKQPYYMSGSSRDIFQNYAGEHTLILDEFRPDILPYSDLLRITDPYGLETEVLAPSRYYDKALACDLIIITSPFNPYDFYSVLFGENQKYKNIDSFYQLERRISLCVFMSQTDIIAMEFRGLDKGYEEIQGTKRANPYSATSRPTQKQNAVDIYNSLFN